MKITQILLTILCLLLSSTLSAFETEAQSLNTGKIFTVNQSRDSTDANPGDGICADSFGQCTLRAAVQESNANGDTNAVLFSLPLPATIILMLGELKITSSIFILGPGARKITIQRDFLPKAPAFRVFNIAHSNSPYLATLAGMSIKNGKGTLGGGVYVDFDANARLIDVTISNNSADTGGGIASGGTVSLTRSLINSNVATQQGGGFSNFGFTSDATITNSTITDNFSTSNSSNSGGGIDNNGKLLLVNATVSQNSTSGAGSNISNTLGGFSTVSLLNTIVGGSSSFSTVSSLSGTFTSLGNNLITDARQSTGFTNGVNNDQVSDNNTIDPLLGNLANNGGQTDTRALLAGSPAINAGNNCVRNGSCNFPSVTIPFLSNDQRKGYRRLIGAAVDIGAFEFGNGAFSSTGTIGFFSLERPGRLLGALAVLTNVVTLERSISSINAFGGYKFENFRTENFYILEIRSKRAPGYSFSVIGLD